MRHNVVARNTLEKRRTTWLVTLGNGKKCFTEVNPLYEAFILPWRDSQTQQVNTSCRQYDSRLTKYEKFDVIQVYNSHLQHKQQQDRSTTIYQYNPTHKWYTPQSCNSRPKCLVRWHLCEEKKSFELKSTVMRANLPIWRDLVAFHSILQESCLGKLHKHENEERFNFKIRSKTIPTFVIGNRVSCYSLGTHMT